MKRKSAPSCQAAVSIANPFLTFYQEYFKKSAFVVAIMSCCVLSYSQTTDDYRTRGSGDWNGASTWQRYNGSAWANIATGPTNSNKAITILNTHTVTVTADVTADQLVVNSGGILIVNASRTLTIANGSGTDITIAGSATNNGTITLTGAISNTGSLTNNGTITTGSNPFGNSATFINAGTTTANCAVTNSGTLTNSGTFVNNNTLTNTGTISNSGAISNTGTFTNNNTCTMNGTFTNTSTVNGTGTLSFVSGSEYVHAKNGGPIPTATWNAGSTCTISGITNTVPSGLGQSFGNFKWNNTSQNSDINLGSALTTINGNLEVVSTGTQKLLLANNAALTMNIGGSLIQTGGRINFSAGSSTGAIIVNVSGNFTQSSGDFDFGSGAASTTRTPALNISGDFSQTGSATMGISSTDLDIRNGTITFNKSGTQTFSIATQANLTNTNFVVASGSTLELNSDVTLSSNDDDERAGSFTVNSGGSLDVKTNKIVTGYSVYYLFGFIPIYYVSNNDFALSTGATLVTANTNGVQSGSNGSISSSIANVAFSSGANYSFNGTSPQNSGTFTTSPTANQVNNLTLNNTGGGVTLQQNLAIAGTCYFTAGPITTSNLSLLIFNDNALASGAHNVPNASYVNGPVRKIGNDAFVFPTGKSNVGYMPCAISAPSNTTHAFTAEYKRNSATLLGLISVLGLNHVSNCEYWDINRTTGTSTVNVTLYWSGISPCNAAAYVTDLSKLVVAHHNGATWNAYGRNSSSGNGAAGSVTWNNVSSFSPFSLGSTDPIANPLQINLSDIKAYKINDGNKIEWTNLTEESIAKYEVERSANGTTFTSIASVLPIANNNQAQQYSTIDAQPLNGTNFYRVKATEYSGTFSYSTIVKVVSANGGDVSASIYPNPVSNGQFTIQLSNYERGNYQLQLMNMAGQKVITKSLQHNGGAASVSFNTGSSLNAGIYVLQITGEGRNETMKISVK